MPDKTDAGKFHPEALRAARKNLGMSQQQLADAIKCTKDTVSRWERGTTRDIRPHLRKPLCDALKVKWEKLTKAPEQGPERPGDTKLSLPVKMHARSSLYFVAERYGIRPRDVLELAPLLFLVVAERSLLEREKRLGEIRTKLYEADDTLDNDCAHLRALVGAPSIAAGDRLAKEEWSIRERDVFGRLLEYPYWREGDEGPFVHFLRGLVEDLPHGAVTDIQSDDGDMVDWYRIADDTLRECTGISDDDEEDVGWSLLHYLHCGAIDFAECMRVKRSRDETEYAQWLSDALVDVVAREERAMERFRHFMMVEGVEKAKPADGGAEQ